MIAKVHKREDGTILVAVCDTELLGTRVEEGANQLDLTGDFYKGDERSEEEVGDLLRNADCINVVGAKSVALALKEELIEKTHVLVVAGVPHAEAVLVHD